MATIRVEEYTCDFCSKPIKLEEVYAGTLAVRKRGRPRQEDGSRLDHAPALHPGSGDPVQWGQQ